MSEFVFLLLVGICIGFIYIVHKYFSKSEFYLLGIIYTIISFLMSFKLINIFGMDVNPSIIFTSGIFMIIYYFINRYDVKEYKKFILLIFSTSIVCNLFLLSTSFMIPSIYDNSSNLYQSLILDNLVLFILYPVSILVTSCLSGYCFRGLKEENKKNIKNIIAIIGIMFIYSFIFIYFSYAVLIRFNKALLIAVENYFISSIIMIMYMFIINKIFNVKKVK